MVPVVLGPTAAGKSAIALELASLHANIEIVSADSRQIYRGMDVGTAKPTPHEQSLVRHHLIDIVNPDTAYSAGQYAAAARAVIDAIILRGALPVVVGGSGFYIKALFEGLSAPEVDPVVMRELERESSGDGYEALVRELETIDPEAAAAHPPENRVKTLRALACYRQTGMRYSDYAGARGLGAYGHEPLYIGIASERIELYSRINERALRMVEHGLLEETRGLLASGVARNAPGMRTVGYREAIAHIDGEIDRDTMIAAIQQATRRYAKRQMTWFRRVDVARWYEPSEATAREIVQQWRAAGIE